MTNIAENVAAFITELELLSKKYNLSLNHESDEGNFIIQEYIDDNIEQLRRCILDIRVK